jgi:hypothetical protein
MTVGLGGTSPRKKNTKPFAPSLYHFCKAPFRACSLPSPPPHFLQSTSPGLNLSFSPTTRVLRLRPDSRSPEASSRGGDGTVAVVLRGGCGGDLDGGDGAVRAGRCQRRGRAPHGGPQRAAAAAHDQAHRVPPHRRGRLLLLVCSLRLPRPYFGRLPWSAVPLCAACASRGSIEAWLLPQPVIRGGVLCRDLLSAIALVACSLGLLPSELMRSCSWQALALLGSILVWTAFFSVTWSLSCHLCECEHNSDIALPLLWYNGIGVRF